jgi:hypothetical protein
MTLYQQAYNIVLESLDETLIPVPARLPAFRRYLTTLSARHKKKFITRVQGKQLFIKQYYEL